MMMRTVQAMSCAAQATAGIAVGQDGAALRLVVDAADAPASGTTLRPIVNAADAPASFASGIRA